MITISKRVVLDAGALIAVERNNRSVVGRITATILDGGLVIVPSSVIAQVWRRHPSQARLAQLLPDLEIAPFDPFVRRIGELCDKAKTSDICDAQVALATLFYDAEIVYTSDPDDIAHLLDVCGLPDRTVKV
ncbi:MAG: hypothetical protein ACKV2T_11495 [Kofleriaceae bacterium]